MSSLAIELDSAISRDLKRVNDMLKRMHDERLYRELGFSTWAEYLRNRVGKSASWYSRQVKYMDYCEVLGIDPSEANEGSLRALYHLDMHSAMKAWQIALASRFDVNRHYPTHDELMIAVQRVKDLITTRTIELSNGDQIRINDIMADATRTEVVEHLKGGLVKRDYVITARPLTPKDFFETVSNLPADRQYMFSIWCEVTEGEKVL